MQILILFIRNISFNPIHIIACPSRDTRVLTRHSCRLKYLIFSFLHSGVEVKRGVELRHSTRGSAAMCEVSFFKTIFKENKSKC